MKNIASNAIPDAQAAERLAFKEGIRIAAPTMAGIFAWSLVTGMAMVKSGLTIWQALGMSFLVFAGSSQLAVLPLIAVNVPVWVAFATALVVNLRFVIFGAVLGPHFGHLPWWQRVWYGYFNADITLAFFSQRYSMSSLDQPQGKVGFFKGIGYLNWVVWQTGAVLGILLVSRIPESWGVGYAGTLALLAVMIPLIINRAALAGVVVASVVAVAALELPYRLGLLLAVLAGMVAAMAVDRAMDRRKGHA